MHFREIKELCNKETKYADIRMVVADLKRKGFEQKNDKIEIEEEKIDEEVLEKENNEEDSEWYFIEKVPFLRASKYFLSYNCRVVLSIKGYYLEVTGDYIKLGNYPKGYSYNKGNIWIKKPTNNTGFQIVHVNDKKQHLIGYIREEDNLIIFTNPDNEEYTITFNES